MLDNASWKTCRLSNVGEHTSLIDDLDNDGPLNLTNGLENMAKEEEELVPPRSTHLNKPLTSPSTSKEEERVPKLPPGEVDVSPTYFRDLLEAQIPSFNQETEIKFSSLTITTRDIWPICYISQSTHHHHKNSSKRAFDGERGSLWASCQRLEEGYGCKNGYLD